MAKVTTEVTEKFVIELSLEEAQLLSAFLYGAVSGFGDMRRSLTGLRSDLSAALSYDSNMDDLLFVKHFPKDCKGIQLK